VGTTIRGTAADGHELSIYRADPKGAPRGALVIVQEIFGVNSHIRAVCDDHAKEGYVAVAPALFDRVEPGIELGYQPDDVSAGRAIREKVSLEQALADVEAAAKLVAGIGRTGVVGYCWGGTVALLSAQRLGLPAVSYYGARNTAYFDQPLKAPVIFHFGATDKSIPPEAIGKHRKAWPDAPVYVYEGAGHAFNRDVDPAHYNEAAATLARQRTLAFFDRHLAGKA
jgi:carboxymethylenebutenolidase